MTLFTNGWKLLDTVAICWKANAINQYIWKLFWVIKHEMFLVKKNNKHLMMIWKPQPKLYIF